MTPPSAVEISLERFGMDVIKFQLNKFHCYSDTIQWKQLPRNSYICHDYIAVLCRLVTIYQLMFKNELVKYFKDSYICCHYNELSLVEHLIWSKYNELTNHLGHSKDISIQRVNLLLAICAEIATFMYSKDMNTYAAELPGILKDILIRERIIEELNLEGGMDMVKMHGDGYNGIDDLLLELIETYCIPYGKNVFPTGIFVTRVTEALRDNASSFESNDTNTDDSF